MKDTPKDSVLGQSLNTSFLSNCSKAMIIKERKFRKRRDVQALQYRQGPSSLDDEKSFFGHSKKQVDSPKGLDELVPHTPHKVDLITELAGKLLYT